MQEDRFQVLTFRKPKERCPLCTTHQPETWYQSLTAQRLTLGKRSAERKSEQTHSLCSSANSSLTPVLGSTNICPRNLLTGGATALHAPGSGPPPGSGGKQAVLATSPAPLATTADPRRGSSLGSSGYVSGSPSGLQKADTTRVNRNRDLETYKHSCVLLSDTDGWGKGPLSFFRLAHR